MPSKLFLLASILFVQACNDEPKTYNECLLKNITKTTNNYVIFDIKETCFNMFERSFSLGGILSLDEVTLNITKNERFISAQVKNDADSIVVRKFRFKIQIYDKPQTDGGSIQTELYWDQATTIEPFLRKKYVFGLANTPIPAHWTWSIENVRGVFLR